MLCLGIPTVSGPLRRTVLIVFDNIQSIWTMAFLSAPPLLGITSVHRIRSDPVAPSPNMKMVDRRTCLKQLALSVAAISFSRAGKTNAAVYSPETKADFAPVGDPKKIET